MTDVQTLRGQLTQAAGSARVVVRCLNGGRDLQESSQRAVMLLVDTLDSIHRLKDQISFGEDRWLVEPPRLVALAEILECFASTMKSMELYFQPGGVGVTFYRKQLLERTFLLRLEQYKIMFLLAMQPDSRLALCEFVLVNSECADLNSYPIVRFECIPRALSYSDHVNHFECIGPKVDFQFEERILGITSQLASDHFITLADLCNRRLQGTGQWIFYNDEYRRWLLGSTKTLYCVGPPGAGKTFLS
ncbi:hypothetical protein BDV12DRAFT_27628 [Aspergillus spectabilis]